MWVALTLLAMMRPPHLCDEWGGVASAAAPAVAAPAPAAVAPPPPPPPPPPVPSALAQAERTRYRIDYGVLEIGELEVAFEAAAPGSGLVHADGHGVGGVLGLGHMENRIASDFDLVKLESRRWDNARSGSEGDLRDRGTQVGAGRVEFSRERPGRPQPETAIGTFAAPLLDPLGFLLRLRVEPPAAGPRVPPQILYVLDGQALWRVTVTNVGRVEAPEGALPGPVFRLDGEADPLFWGGGPDTTGERKHRSFKLWLSDDTRRVPLRLEMPVGIANVAVALTEIRRGSESAR